MFVNSDFSDLLRLFNANQVKYLVIGGYALIQYAELLVPFIARQVLIAAKRASGRPQDWLDVKQLTQPEDTEAGPQLNLTVSKTSGTMWGGQPAEKHSLSPMPATESFRLLQDVVQ